MQISTALDRTLKLLAIIALSTMIILVFFNAVLRYFFDSGIAWSEEFARICFVYMNLSRNNPRCKGKGTPHR